MEKLHKIKLQIFFNEFAVFGHSLELKFQIKKNQSSEKLRVFILQLFISAIYFVTSQRPYFNAKMCGKKRIILELSDFLGRQSENLEILLFFMSDPGHDLRSDFSGIVWVFRS